MQLLILFLNLFVYVYTFDDVINAGVSSEMLKQGKIQYQLLQERGKLPKYGTCWTQAVQHIEEGCRALSEDTQSDIALHLTNCFLEMSGHETYNCVLDKKPNLRGICINSMTDRAFNVYTEFYTHTQNMCWFLRGQVWHETISENTLKVGKQLETSAKNQGRLLKNQLESLQLQEKLMRHGLELEKILDDFLLTTKKHQEIFQSWILGEISWLDTVIFYVSSSFLIMFFTCNPRTANARLPIFILLSFNILIERFLCYKMSYKIYPSNIKEVHGDYYKYIWYLRYIFVGLAVIMLIISAYFYKDYVIENHILLEKLNTQMLKISENLNCYKSNRQITNGHLEIIQESKTATFNGVSKYLNNLQNGLCAKAEPYELNLSCRSSRASSVDYSTPQNGSLQKSKEDVNVSRVHNNSGRKKLFSFEELQSGARYNLRSRHGTPDLNI